jgi:mercuric ion binding protein
MMKLLIAAAVFGLSAHSLAATQSTTLSVPSMNCASCPITVKLAIGKVDGVRNVRTNLAQRQTTVTFDDTKTTVEAIMQATKDAGYPSKVVGQ